MAGSAFLIDAGVAGTLENNGTSAPVRRKIEASAGTMTRTRL
jgi:hypothetical protein